MSDYLIDDAMKTETKRRIAVMQAWLDGKTIERSYIGDLFSGAWETTEHPRWNWDDLDYRVKP